MSEEQIIKILREYLKDYEVPNKAKSALVWCIAKMHRDIKRRKQI